MSEHVGGQSAYLSQRQDPAQAGLIPSLTSTAIRRLADLFVPLFVNAGTAELKQSEEIDLQKERLRLLPPHLSSRLLAAVFENIPSSPAGQAALSLIPHFISDTTDSFIMPASVSSHFAVSPLLLASLRSATSMSHLNLSSQRKLTDSQLAGLLPHLPNLQTLCLRGCTEIGDKSLLALANAKHDADKLSYLNLNFTAATWKGLAKVMARYRNLEVLKLAAVPYAYRLFARSTCSSYELYRALTDANVARIMDALMEAVASSDGPAPLPLAKLTSLKLRSTAIGAVGVSRILAYATAVTRLDISFTPVNSLDFLKTAFLPTPSSFILEKLSLSGLTLRRGTLKRFLNALSDPTLPENALASLRTLKIGSLAATSALSHMSGEPDVLNPPEFSALVQCLMKCPGLTSLSLPYVAFHASSYQEFVNSTP